MAYVKTVWENGTTPINETNLNKIENELETLDNNLSKFGKKLWEGTFTSGSITVDGLSNYTVIAVSIGSVICIGSKFYGVGGFGAYGGYETGFYNYRFSVNGNVLTINNENRGGSDGTQNMPVSAIYGLF